LSARSIWAFRTFSLRAMQEPSFTNAPSSVNDSLSFVLPLTPRARIQKLVILRGSEHLRRWVPADQSLKGVQDTDDFEPETHKLLGVHASGQRATEIISVEYFRDMVFNYPTRAEACKVADLDGLK
jgi:hypothetical protein